LIRSHPKGSEAAATRNGSIAANNACLVLPNISPIGRLPDPLLGWKRADYLAVPNATIVKDYQDYIQNLSHKEKERVDSASVLFFKDGKGQHAIKIEIPLNGT